MGKAPSANSTKRKTVVPDPLVVAAAGLDPAASDLEDREDDLVEIENSEGEESDFFEGLDELFQDQTQRVKVQVIRTAPTYVGETKVYGYVCYLKPGQGIEWLAENHGGGTYKVVKWVNGQKSQTVTIDIAGDPIRKIPGQPTRNLMPAAAAADSALDGFEFMGIKADGDDDRFFRRLERTLMLQSMLEKRRQPDMNIEMIKLFMEKASANSLDGMLDSFTKLKDVAEAIMPAEKSDSGFSGAISEGLKAFALLVSQKNGQPVQRPAQVPAQVVSSPAPQIEPPQPMATATAVPMNLLEANQIAQTCVNALVGAYGTQPAAEAVEGIKLLLPELTPEVKALIRSQRAALWSLTRIAANEQYDSFEVAALETYFTEVMNLLTAE